MRNKKAVSVSILFLMILIYCIYFILVVENKLAEMNYLNYAESIFTFIVLIISFFCSIIFHEGGHLLFGFLTGYKFLSFQILNLLIYKKNNKLKFSKQPLTREILGQCLMVYKKEFSDDIPYKLYNLGGVIINFTLFSISTVLSFLVSNKLLFVFLFCISAVNYLLLCTNSIPYLSDYNDGTNILLLKNLECRKALYDQLRMEESFYEDKTYAQLEFLNYDYMNTDLIVLPVYVNMMYHYFIVGNYFEANNIKIHLYNNLHNYPKMYHELLICEIAYCDIVFNNNFSAIELYSKLPVMYIRALKNSKYPSAAVYALMYEVFYENNYASAMQKLPYVKSLVENKCFFYAEKEKFNYSLMYLQNYLNRQTDPFEFNSFN